MRKGKKGREHGRGEREKERRGRRGWTQERRREGEGEICNLASPSQFSPLLRFNGLPVTGYHRHGLIARRPTVPFNKIYGQYG